MYEVALDDVVTQTGKDKALKCSSSLLSCPSPVALCRW
jgi:hypothetical protein